MKITVIGTGYVGLVTAVSFAESGNDVVCIGRNKKKILEINGGRSPFFEPGLDEAITRVIKNHRLSVSDELDKYVAECEIIVLAVGTPTVNNKIDLSELKEACRAIGIGMRKSDIYQVIVVKSTVVPQTTQDVVLPILEKFSRKRAHTFGLCMNPEFLREGSALIDATKPDRIIIGQYDNKSGATYAKAFHANKCPILFTTLTTAEMTKYVSNSLLSTLISFSNEMSRICEIIPGVDAVDVWEGLHLDGRLSPVINGKKIYPGILSYIRSGCGYGGSCFPKDTKALYYFAQKRHIKTPLLKSVIDINTSQPLRLVSILKDVLGSIDGKRIAVLGLAFKPDTDDIRESPALTIIATLLDLHASVVCHDPQVYKHGIPMGLTGMNVQLAPTLERAIQNSDAVVLVTSWNEYKLITPRVLKKLMQKPLLIDGRRMFNKRLFEKNGVTYSGIGLKPQQPSL